MEIGTDIIKISRIEKIYKKYGENFLKKVFTESEIDYIQIKRYSIETIAGMVSAKESISKAMGTGIGVLKWKDIKIEYTDRNKPIVIVEEETLEKLKISRKVKFAISISHEDLYAVSFAIMY